MVRQQLPYPVHYLFTHYRRCTNTGPLLWHFENSSNPSDTSIELTLDEVQALAVKIGFEIHNQKMLDATYVDIGDSMLSHVYHAAFWTATKKK